MILNSSETTSAPVVDHFPTVGHLKCTVKAVYIKSFGDQKGGSSEPLRTPPAYGPASSVDNSVTRRLVPVHNTTYTTIYITHNTYTKQRLTECYEGQ